MIKWGEATVFDVPPFVVFTDNPFFRSIWVINAMVLLRIAIIFKIIDDILKIITDS